MNAIERKVYVTRKTRTEPINVVDGANAIPLIFEIMDAEIPTGAVRASAQVRHPSREDAYTVTCMRQGNTIRLTPPDGFFTPGHNKLQIDIVANYSHIITFAVDVYAEANYGKTGIAPSLDIVRPYVERAEEAAERAEEAYDKIVESGGVYRSKDLTQAFGEEIGGNVWAWLKHRISQGDFEGIRVGDYIPVTCKNGVTFHAQIAGINTYKNLGHGSNRVVGNHIDFVSRELWPEAHQMNKVGWNNGLGSVKFPWSVSDLYFWLNSLSGTVAGNTVDPPNTGTVAVDYTAGGVLRQLPDDLAAAISEKDAYLPQRHNASAQLSSDSMAGMAYAGKLWIPTEMEGFGTAVFGSGEFGISGSTQYPLFQSKEHIVKPIAGSDTAASWWLASAKEGSKTSFCCVFGYGTATQATADAADRYVPVCFRIE